MSEYKYCCKDLYTVYIWHCSARESNMSKGKLSPKKARASANDAESVMRTTNEKILQDCYSLYVDEEKGKRRQWLQNVKVSTYI